MESRDGDVPYNADHGDEFIIVDITMKNIGNNALESSDVIGIGVALLDDEDGKSGNHWEYDWAEQITGEIQPGEEAHGQLVFQRPPSEYYDLTFGWGLSTVSNEVTWRFDADEAQ